MAKDKQDISSNIECITKNIPHDNYWVLCLECTNKWIATIPSVPSDDSNLFRLECPVCSKKNTFISWIPHFKYNGEQNGEG